MRSIIVALYVIFGFSKIVIAESLPDGCYVTYSNPGSCYIAPSGTLDWDVAGSQEYLVAKYGFATGLIIDRGRIDANKLVVCNADYNNLVLNYNNLNTNNSSNLNLLNQWIAYANAQVKLAKRLRKKCGAPCRKIK
jgi:hypothetical protein